MKETHTQQNFTPRTATITVTSDRSVQPYIDTFAITPQNIIERNHGSLVGFFRIYDTSEDSAYIANFLTSVLKKEFYASTRRSAEVALEAALAKVNMALGELARHDSTQWVGKVDGAVCVFTNTSVCFSSCGHGSVQLFRNNTLTQISLPANDAAHVLSTFSDIACGPLHTNDTFIIASREFADVLPHKECERACQRYTHTEREQLFRTALVNKTNGSCIHLIEITPARAGITHRSAAFDVGEEEITMPENVFSAQTFTQKSTDTHTPTHTDNTLQTPRASKKKIVDVAASHIYLQGDETDTHRTPFGDILLEHTASLRSALRRYTQTTRENIHTSYTALRTKGAATARSTAQRTTNATRTSFLTALTAARSAATRSRSALADIAARAKKTTPAPAIDPTHTPPEDVSHDTDVSIEDSVAHETPQAVETTEQSPRIKPSFVAPTEALHIEQSSDTDTHDETTEGSEDTLLDPAPKSAQKHSQLESFLARTPLEQLHNTTQSSPSTESITTVLGKITETIGAHASFLYSRLRNTTAAAPRTLTKNLRTLMPHPRRLLARMRALSRRDRIVAFGIIFCIIVAPLIFGKITHRTESQQPDSSPREEAVDTSIPQTTRDTTSTHIDRAYTLHTDNAIHTLLRLRGETYVITPQTITHITNATTKKSFTVPASYGTVRDAVAMDDLNMIILRTDKDAIVSFTPQGATKFDTNTITFPAGLSIDSMAAYRTYLYFFDSNGNDIYRYPRATGGFGAAVNWLTDNTSFTAPHDIFIDGTIYMTDADGAITAFFNHKKTIFPEVTLTPALHADVLFTTDEDAPLFILDQTAQRIVAVDKKTGAIQRNVTNDDFSAVTTFTVNERLSTITALLEDGTLATYRY